MLQTAEYRSSCDRLFWCDWCNFFLYPPFSRRLRGVKIAHRKAENQIKMAKMIMMNELNKRANLLIEQLEVITFSLSPSVLSPGWWFYSRGIRTAAAKIGPESARTSANDNLSKPLKRTARGICVYRESGALSWFWPPAQPRMNKKNKTLAQINLPASWLRSHAVVPCRKSQRTSSSVWRTNCRGR